MHHYRFIILLVGFSLVCFSGCGPKGPRVNYVEGIVTLDGKPIDGVTVNFVPPSETAPNAIDVPLLAMGRTNKEGKYALSTARGSEVDAGTTVGKYSVNISKRIISAPPPGFAGKFVPKMQDIIPPIFGTSSPINVEVVRGENVFNFALKSDGTFEITP